MHVYTHTIVFVIVHPSLVPDLYKFLSSGDVLKNVYAAVFHTPIVNGNIVAAEFQKYTKKQCKRRFYGFCEFFKKSLMKFKDKKSLKWCKKS